MNGTIRLLMMSSLVLALAACGDDDATFDGGTADGFTPDGMTPDAPGPDAGDPCTGVDPTTLCSTAGASCADDALTTCAANAAGCLVTTTTDCSADGGTCDDSGAVAMCSTDPCMGVTDCATEGRTCNADGDLEVCAADAAGCLVAAVTVCADMGGAICDDTVDPVACVAPACAAADATGIVLDCATGTLTGTTTGGTSSFDAYCEGGADPYGGAENVYVFSGTDLARVTITAERTSGTEDMDLFVLDGGDGTSMCSEMSECITGSIGSTATEEVTFNYVPGSVAYVAYDAYDTVDGVADYTLTVTCETSTCGDSTIEGAEVCDDGNGGAGDGCSEFCQVEPGYLCTEDAAGESICVLSCGDSEVNGTDECDDGDVDGGDGCSATCTVEDGYSCTEDAAGLSTCVLSCGDGEINGDDECDDGGATAGDGCSDTCTVEAGYLCVSSPSACTMPLASMDGVLEETDTAWTRPSASCGTSTDDTVFESFEYTNSTAADQVVDILASFDGLDGFLFVFDGSVDPADPTAGCLLGDDDFNGTAQSFLEGVTIAAGATITVVVSGYEAGEYGPYSVAIAQGLGCGNGVLGGEFPNECDDGNTTAGDGCSATCAVEAGYACVGEPSTCDIPVCGNSTIEATEVCDDGNTTDGDGCEGDCASAIFSGSLAATDPQWARPSSSCGMTSPADHYYDLQSFAWAGTFAADLAFTVAWTGVDGFVHAYTDPFDAVALTNCIAGGDDFGGVDGSQVAFTAAPGTTYSAVMSTFSDGDTGDWTLTVSLAP